MIRKSTQVKPLRETKTFIDDNDETLVCITNC